MPTQKVEQVDFPALLSAVAQQSSKEMFVVGTLVNLYEMEQPR